MFTITTSLQGQPVSSFNAETLEEAYATGDRLIQLGVIDSYQIW